jgi:hypothetical protein
MTPTDKADSDCTLGWTSESSSDFRHSRANIVDAAMVLFDELWAGLIV